MTPDEYDDYINSEDWRERMYEYRLEQERKKRRNDLLFLCVSLGVAVVLIALGLGWLP